MEITYKLDILTSVSLNDIKNTDISDIFPLGID